RQLPQPVTVPWLRVPEVLVRPPRLRAVRPAARHHAARQPRRPLLRPVRVRHRVHPEAQRLPRGRRSAAEWGSAETDSLLAPGLRGSVAETTGPRGGGFEGISPGATEPRSYQLRSYGSLNATSDPGC